MADDNVVPIGKGKPKRPTVKRGPVHQLLAHVKPPDWPDFCPEPGSDAYFAWVEDAAPVGKPDWKYWMLARQARAAENGVRNGRQKGLTPEQVIEIALEDAGVANPAELKAANLLAPHRAKAAAKLLAMLDSKDPSDRRFAIQRILEITDGKPAQTLIEKQDGPRIIRYETAALMPELPPFVPMIPAESPGDAIALADRDDDE